MLSVHPPCVFRVPPVSNEGVRRVDSESTPVATLRSRAARVDMRRAPRVRSESAGGLRGGARSAPLLLLPAPPPHRRRTWSRNPDVLKAGENVSYALFFRMFYIVRNVF